MSEHEAYRGVMVDHLYQDCPNLTRAKRGVWKVGYLLLGTVDPLGTDVCGLCRRRYEREVSDD